MILTKYDMHMMWFCACALFQQHKEYHNNKFYWQEITFYVICTPSCSCRLYSITFCKTFHARTHACTHTHIYTHTQSSSVIRDHSFAGRPVDEGGTVHGTVDIQPETKQTVHASSTAVSKYVHMSLSQVAIGWNCTFVLQTNQRIINTNEKHWHQILMVWNSRKSPKMLL